MQIISLPVNAQGKWKYDFIVPDNGSFVQAINAANRRPDKNKRYRIFLKPSYYRIKGEGNTISCDENGKNVSFPSPITTLTAPNTSICGESWSTTQVENCPQHEGLNVTSTLYLKGADSTYIQDIELWSNYKNIPNPYANSSVALNEENCKGNILKQVSLLSTKNTYYTNNGGTTYLEDCRICGTTDFICGGGTVMFNHCEMKMLPCGTTGNANIVAAPATENGKKYGYVFVDCYFDGEKEQENKFLIGRPWKNYPKCVLLNCCMNVNPASEGWGDYYQTKPSYFSEYNTTDGHFELLDLSKRRTSYNVNGQLTNVNYSPSMSDEESENYSINKVFDGWRPDNRADLVHPPVLKASGNVIYWDDIPEAGCYVVCLDRKIIAFTTQTRYTIPSLREGACYSVRCANWYGGLGPRSKDIVYPFKESK